MTNIGYPQTVTQLFKDLKCALFVFKCLPVFGFNVIYVADVIVGICQVRFIVLLFRYPFCFVEILQGLCIVSDISLNNSQVIIDGRLQFVIPKLVYQ